MVEHSAPLPVFANPSVAGALAQGQHAPLAAEKPDPHHVAQFNAVLHQLEAMLSQLTPEEKAYRDIRSRISDLQALGPGQVTPQALMQALQVSQAAVDADHHEDIAEAQAHQNRVDRQRHCWERREARHAREHFTHLDYAHDPHVHFDASTGRFRIHEGHLESFAKAHGFDVGLVKHLNGEEHNGHPGIHYAPHDPVKNDARLTAFDATMAKIDPEIHQAQMGAKTVADRMTNSSVGYLRYAKFASPAELKAMHQAYDVYEKSTSLTPEQRQAAHRFIWLADHGYMSAEAIREAGSKDLFNQPEHFMRHVQEGYDKRVDDLKLTTSIMPAAQRQAVDALAAQHGVAQNLPPEEKLFELQKMTMDGKNPELSKAMHGIETTANQIQGMRVFADAVHIVDHHIPAEKRDAEFYKLSAAERMAKIEQLYTAQHGGQKMPPEVRNLVEMQVRHIQTPQEVGQFLHTYEKEVQPSGNMQPMMGLMWNQMKKSHQEAAGKGDAASKQTLQEMAQLEENLRVLEKQDPAKAKEVRQQLLSDGFEQASKGKADIHRLNEAVGKAVAERAPGSHAKGEAKPADTAHAQIPEGVKAAAAAAAAPAAKAGTNGAAVASHTDPNPASVHTGAVASKRQAGAAAIA